MSSILLQLKVFAVDPVSRRLIADQLSVVPGNNILDYTQSIPASGTVNLGALASNSVIMLSTTPVVTQNYVTNAGAVVVPDSSPYAQPSSQLPSVNITFNLVGGGSVTFNNVQSLVVVPINVVGVTIQNLTSGAVNAHIIQSTS